MLRIYDIGDKLLSGIKSMYVDSIACGRVKVSDNECFKIDSGVRQRCIMSPLLYTVHMVAEMKKVNLKIERRRREGIMPGLLYADYLVMCGESEKDLRQMVLRFIEGCRRRGLKVNTGKSGNQDQWVYLLAFN